MRKLGIVLVCCLPGMLVGAAPAAANLTLGVSTRPGNEVTECTTGEGYFQTGSDPAYDYVVPAYGGAITGWSANTIAATPGSPYGLAIARPVGSGYTVVGVDDEKFPSPLPASGEASFTLAHPIAVDAGDLLGIDQPTGTAAACIFSGTGVSSADTIFAGSPIVAGATLTDEGGFADSLVNISATLEQADGVSVTQRLLPASITAGGDAAFVVSIAGTGPSTPPVSLTDAVAPGLTIQSVSSGSDSCAVSGQNVTCTAPSTPSSIAIVVSARAAGSYTNLTSATTQLPNPTPQNAVNSTALEVTNAPTAAACHPTSLAGIRLPQAKALIGAFGCRVGKVTKKRSKKVSKGDVISNTPHGGARPLGTRIAIVESSGRPKRR
jgi:hypothetical protein